VARRYWLAKSEPFKYAWDDLVRDGSTCWDGVRNAQARNNLAAMKKGDRVLYYHSNEGREVVGVAVVTQAAYPDPTSDDERWLAVEIAPLAPLAAPVSLADIKADPKLRDVALLRQPRLSVMPIDKPAFDRIVKKGGAKP
jgi:predicted RNA-binding protein with PUA-like domain